MGGRLWGHTPTCGPLQRVLESQGAWQGAPCDSGPPLCALGSTVQRRWPWMPFCLGGVPCFLTGKWGLSKWTFNSILSGKRQGAQSLRTIRVLSSIVRWEDLKSSKGTPIWKGTKAPYSRMEKPSSKTTVLRQTTILSPPSEPQGR